MPETAAPGAERAGQRRLSTLPLAQPSAVRASGLDWSVRGVSEFRVLGSEMWYPW